MENKENKRNNFLGDLKNSLESGTVNDEIVNTLNKINENAEKLDGDDIKEFESLMSDLGEVVSEEERENMKPIDTPINETSALLNSQIENDKKFTLFANLSNKIWEYNVIITDLKKDMKEVYLKLVEDGINSDVLNNELETLKNKNVELFNVFTKED